LLDQILLSKTLFEISSQIYGEGLTSSASHADLRVPNMSTLQNILTQFDINNTFFLIFFGFIVTYLLMANIALKPLSRALVERDNRITGREHRAVELNKEFERIQAQLSEEMLRARREAGETFVALKTKASQDQKALLDQARQSASAEIRNARASVAEKMSVETRKLEDEVPKLAKMILDQILGGKPRSISSNSSSVEV
jgi:F0F1-type ATP synthase membrane subunit b/b'